MSGKVHQTWRRVVAAGTLILATGCGFSRPPDGAARVRAILPAGERCQSTIGDVDLSTMESLSEMRGKLGRVVTSSVNLDSDPSYLSTASAFRPIDVRFFESGGTYGPANYQTLLAVSLYHAVEKGYQLLSSLVPEADFATTVPGFATSTYIVLDARRDGPDGKEITDNAEYHPKPAGASFFNYLFSYPSRDPGDRALGLNLGIMVHEYAHLAFNYLFNEKVKTLKVTQVHDTASDNAWGSIDEGVADYFGFVASSDPAYFLCTFPGENRDLSVRKNLGASGLAAIKGDRNFDFHAGGAIVASINYEIGKIIGHQVNAKYLAQTVAQLATCGSVRSGGGIALTLEGFGQCHAAAAGSHSSTVQSAYNAQLGGTP